MATPTLTTTNFTRVNACDNTTGWSNLGGGPGVTAQSDILVQGTAALGRRVDNGTAGFALDLGGTTANHLDFTPGGTEEGEHIFFWINILQPDLINSAVMRIADHSQQGGTAPNPGESYDYEVFPANPYSGGWFRACIDLRIDVTTDNGGNTRSGKLSDVRWIGYFFDMGNVGGTTPNCNIDAIDRGRGLIVTGGSTTDKITWADIASVATSNSNAFGTIEERSGVFFLLGEWQFGDASNDCYFEDTDQICVWSGRLGDNGNTTDNIINALNTDLNSLVVVEGTGTTDVIMGAKVGSGNDATGSNGLLIQAAPAKSGVENNLRLDFSDPDITNVEIFGSEFKRCLADGLTDASIVFSDDATNGPNHEVSGCVFDQCGLVDLGRVSAQNLIFSSTTQSNAESPFGSVQHWDDSASSFSDGTTSVDEREGDSFVTGNGAVVNNDEFYFGFRDTFKGIVMMSGGQSAGATCVWEYWDGTAWVNIDTNLDDVLIPNWISSTNNNANYGNRTTLEWATIPTDWAQTTVNSVGPLFYVRQRFTANGAGSGSDQGTIYWAHTLAPVANGAALLYNSNIDLVNAIFRGNEDADSGEKAHGVEHRASGTFAYTTWNFASNDADILFSAATGNLTINANAGSDPTTSTTIGTGSVTINTNVTVTLTGLIGTPATEVRVYDTGTTTELDGQENVTTGSFAFSLDATDFVDIRIHNVEYEYISIINFDMPATDASIPIQQRFDRNYSNP